MRPKLYQYSYSENSETNPPSTARRVFSWANSSMAATGAGDVTLAGGLLTSPVWASWLAEINHMLTTITLVIGILIGLVRLWVAWKEQGRERDKLLSKHDKLRPDK